MTQKHLLLAAASVAVLSAHGSFAAPQSVRIDQFLPQLDGRTANRLETVADLGGVSALEIDQVISNAANGLQTNLGAVDLSIRQGVGDDALSFQGGSGGPNNIVNLSSSSTGNAEFSGAQVGLNAVNTIDIPGVAAGGGPVSIDFAQQVDPDGNRLAGGLYQITANTVGVQATTGNASATGAQTIESKRNTVSIAASGLDRVTGDQFAVEDTLLASGILPSVQVQANEITAETGTGNADVNGDQQGFHLANGVDVSGTASEIALTQQAAAVEYQYITNTLAATASEVGDGAATVRQAGVNRLNNASVADVTGALTLQQVADQTTVPLGSGLVGEQLLASLNFVSVSGGDQGGGSASIALDGAGQGQVARNALNTVSFGTLGTLTLGQFANDLQNGVIQTSANRLEALGGDAGGGATIMASGGSGQVAFNSFNSATGDLGALGGNGTIDQTAAISQMSARNSAEATAGSTGNASIAGLSQTTGSLLNSLKLPGTAP